MKIFDTMKRGLTAAYMSAVMKSSAPLMDVVEEIKGSSKGMADMVLGGIMIAILGFAMLFIGLYVTFVIQTSLPSISGTNAAVSASYNSTQTALNSYVTTVFPVLGLSLLIVGFAIIFVALRSGMGGATTGR